MKKESEKPSGLELMMSLVLTFVSIAIVSFVGACVIGYYTCSIKNALITLAVGVGIASLSASVKFWILNHR